MKIEKFHNKKERKEQFRTRFQLNNKEFRPVADTRKKLLEMIDEIRAQEHRTKYELPVPKATILLSDLLEKRKNAILKKSENNIAKRVFDLFLSLLPAAFEVTQIKKAHLQRYIDRRVSEVKPQTANREMCTIASALHKANLYYPELENWQCPQIPKAPYKKQRRARIITETERRKLINHLIRPKDHGELVRHYHHRTRLAHIFEFGLLTGLRRKEITGLKFSQFSLEESALFRVKRYKTDTVTEFFPVAKRVCEIIEERRQYQGEYIFSDNGKPIESNYRTLKQVCKDLKIPYGRYLEDGFVLHDARHDFSTRMIQVTDLETTRTFTGHSSDEIMTYLHTNKDRMRKAVRDFEGSDVEKELSEIFEEVKRDEISRENFVAKVKNLVKF